MSAAVPAYRFASAPHAHLAALGVCLLALGALFADTFAAMVATWSRSETYTHGFVILPISLWLLWRRRAALSGLAVAAEPLAVPGLLLLGGGWLLGRFSGINAVEQFAAVTMIPALVALTLGRGYLRAALFPLAFLLLAVPFGAFLVPPLMELTADVTVFLVRASGIPVYREGLFFTLPTGSWSVVEACSGQRYLIASFTLGLLYAYLSYRRWRPRLLFVAASIAVPIAANALRAYMIVMIGHLSDMQLAVGVDHLLYGWVFFGIVMALLFWVGGYWREAPAPDGPAPSGSGSGSSGGPRRADLAVVAAGLLALAAAPAYAALGRAGVPAGGFEALSLPDRLAGWSRGDVELVWRPSYRDLDDTLAATYRRGSREAVVYLGRYRDQSHERELIMWGNDLVAGEPTSLNAWRVVERGTARPGERRLATAIVGRRDEALRVYYGYVVDGEFATGQLGVKWLTLRARLAGRPDTGTLVAVAVPASVAADTAGRFAAAAVDAAVARLTGSGALGDSPAGQAPTAGFDPAQPPAPRRSEPCSRTAAGTSPEALEHSPAGQAPTVGFGAATDAGWSGGAS